MRRLCRYADVITPNITEAALLTGMSTDTEAEELCFSLRSSLDVRNVVVTGVRDGDKIGYHADFDGREVSIMKDYADVSLHGTGDVFSSAFCGELLSGKDMAAALADAADFCDRCVKATLRRLPSPFKRTSMPSFSIRRLYHASRSRSLPLYDSALAAMKAPPSSPLFS